MRAKPYVTSHASCGVGTVWHLHRLATSSPQAGVRGYPSSVVLLLDLLPTDFGYTQQFCLHFCLPYQHNSRDTKTRDFDTCTLIQEIARISSSCFFLSSTLRNSKPRSLVVFQLAYVYDLDTLLLPQSLPVSSHIIAVIFSRSLVSSGHRILCADISAQIQYDICNSTEYAINYSCHSS